MISISLERFPTSRRAINIEVILSVSDFRGNYYALKSRNLREHRLFVLISTRLKQISRIPKFRSNETIKRT